MLKRTGLLVASGSAAGQNIFWVKWAAFVLIALVNNLPYSSQDVNPKMHIHEKLHHHIGRAGKEDAVTSEVYDRAGDVDDFLVTGFYTHIDSTGKKTDVKIQPIVKKENDGVIRIEIPEETYLSLTNNQRRG